MTDKPLQGVKVLVAENEPVIALDIMNELSQAGADVVGPATTAACALAFAAKEDLNCAILDVQLRDGLVFPAAELLRQKGAGIVFLTGYVDIEELKSNWPSAKVLMKPRASGELVKALREVWESKREVG
ncbi:MAG: response regulator [Rhodomicrobium sp.]